MITILPYAYVSARSRSDCTSSLLTWFTAYFRLGVYQSAWGFGGGLLRSSSTNWMNRPNIVGISKMVLAVMPRMRPPTTAYGMFSLMPASIPRTGSNILVKQHYARRFRTFCVSFRNSRGAWDRRCALSSKLRIRPKLWMRP